MNGPGYFLKGLHLLTRPGIRPFVLMPLLINLLLFAVFTVLLVDQFSHVNRWMVDHWGHWLQWVLWLLWLVAALAWLAIYGYFFALISNLIAAPFYGLLAERVQLQLRGKIPEEPFTLKQLVRIAGRSFGRELRKLGYLVPRLLLVALLTLVLAFIPGFNLLVPALWFAWGAWALALENIDYAADNNGVGFPRLRGQIRANRLSALGFGGVALATSGIPLFNLVAIPAAVAGGTALWVDRMMDSPAA